MLQFENKTVVVPNVVMMDVSEAEIRLKALGLVVRINLTTAGPAAVGPDTVLLQSPRAGAEVISGSTITLVVKKR
jgi:beta-lactam-binding protein with PASTA domain